MPEDESVADNDVVCTEDAINEGIDWLLAKKLPPVPDNNPLESGDPVKGNEWSQTGEPISLALDNYNNTGVGCAFDRDAIESISSDALTTAPMTIAQVPLNPPLLSLNQPHCSLSVLV